MVTYLLLEAFLSFCWGDLEVFCRARLLRAWFLPYRLYVFRFSCIFLEKNAKRAMILNESASSVVAPIFVSF